MIRVECPQCRARLKVKDELEGKTGKCPACGTAMLIRAMPSEAMPSEALPSRSVPPASVPPAPVPTVAPPPPGGAVPSTAPTPQPPAVSAGSTAVGPSDADRIPFDSLPDDEPPPPIILAGGERGGAERTAAEASAGLHVATAAPIKLHDPDEEADRPAHVPTHLDLLSHYLICDHKDVVARWQNDGKGWMFKLKDGFTRTSAISTELPSFGNFVLIEIGVERREDGVHLRNITAFRLQEQYALTKLTRGDDAILTTIVGTGLLNQAQRRHVRELVKSKFLPHTWAAMNELLR